MTAAQVAQVFGAKKVGRGKWVTKCPAHPDRHPSLSIAEGKRGVLIRCMSNGCNTRDVVKAAGLRMADLFYSAPTRQVRVRTSLVEQRENLERQLGLVLWLKALESGTKLNGRSDASYREFDAALSRWKPIVNGGHSGGK